MPINLRAINWLASYPKSGNTWVRLFLQSYLTGNSDINAGLRIVPSDTTDALHQTVSPLPLGAMGPKEILLLRPAALLTLACTQWRLPVPVKTHNMNTVIGAINLIPDDLTRASVYLIRDPRDVAVSYARHLDRPIDEVIDMMANENHLTVSKEGVPEVKGSWSRHVRSWEMKANLIVRYEDMLTAPVQMFSAILETFGYDVDKEQVESAAVSVNIQNLADQEKDSGFIEAVNGGFFTKGGGSRWKKELTPEQAKRIEEAHLNVMKDYDYL